MLLYILTAQGLAQTCQLILEGWFGILGFLIVAWRLMTGTGRDFLTVSLLLDLHGLRHLRDREVVLLSGVYQRIHEVPSISNAGQLCKFFIHLTLLIGIVVLL